MLTLAQILAGVSADETSLLFVILVFGCLVGAAVAGWFGRWPVTAALLAVALVAAIIGFD